MLLGRDGLVARSPNIFVYFPIVMVHAFIIAVILIEDKMRSLVSKQLFFLTLDSLQYIMLTT